MTVTTAGPGRAVAASDDERFDRTLAALVGIVEPDVRPAAARPGPVARFVRSHRGSVAIGFAGLAAIGGLVAIGMGSLAPPSVRDQPASVTLAVPAIERPPTPSPIAEPVAPVAVAGRDKAPATVRARRVARAAFASTRRARRTRMASASPRYDVPRASTSQPVPDDARPAARPVLVAAVERTVPTPRGGDADDAAPASPAAAPERRDPPAVRVERRDNVDALRQLRHQW